MSDTPAPAPEPLRCSALAADLDAADFRSEPLRRLWGEEVDDALGRGMREPILRAIHGDDGVLATLGRLLVLGMPQPRAAVAAALPRLGVEGLVELGLAASEGDAVTPTALLRPQSFVDADGIGEWWIASDLDEVALDGPLPADHVLGVGGASRTLAEIIMPVEVDRALDLGTGCGIQALLVARHAGTVIATDISARALAYAELNARLNGVGNVEFRRGSMFDPVAGEAFDLIVSNPPFVITPRVEGVPEYEYRDGGLVGDALVEQFLRTVPSFLTEGGAAQLLGNWESRDAADAGPRAGLDRVASWVPAELDLWVIQREQLTPLAYAELWIRDGGTTPRDAAFTPLLNAWLDDFAARGVTGIGFGYVLVRRPPAPAPARPPARETSQMSRSEVDSETFVKSREPRGSRGQVGSREPLRRIERMPQPVSDVGGALRNGLAAHDLLAEGLPRRLVTAADVTEARHLLPGNDDPNVIELRQGGGFGRTLSVDPALAAFVGACDGELTVMQIVAALADLFEVPLADLWADLHPRIRALIFDGFLLPAE